MKVGFVLVLMLVTACFASGQELENLKHERHKHGHNPKHAVVPASEDRFFTSREGAALKLTSEEPMFTFTVFGDRTGGPDSGVNILADAVRDVNLLEPDLVMTVGDLVQGYSQTDEWLPQMREYRGIMDELVCPWFPVAGNHDIYWRGPNRPELEHEPQYEKHFGPLWYAFEHKDCFFVVLYTDEGNPKSGERNFNKPECQTISPEQLEWLKVILNKSKDAKHVFLFLHHPRWIGGNYGDDWEQVHDVLVEAGNVSACFAGHIHHMRSDPKDGINYITLATVGGHQPGVFPSAGFLHQYHVVTVRENQVAVTAYPVGEAIDVLELTKDLRRELEKVVAEPVVISGNLVLDENGGVNTELEIRLKNPTKSVVEYTLTTECADHRWSFVPDHFHGSFAGGEEAILEVAVSRVSQAFDSSFDVPVLRLATEYLTKSSRYPLPVKTTALPFTLAQEPEAEEDLVMDFNGQDQALLVSSEQIPIEKELTLEAWFQARAFGRRVGLVTKAQSSDYGLFVSEGRPEFVVFVGGSYLVLEASEPMLEAGKWHHLAGVYDGESARLYLDGELIESDKREGERRTNELPLVIGADVSRRGEKSHFNGLIGAVQLSKGARYFGESFETKWDLEADENSLFLYNMDFVVGNQVFDQSLNAVHAEMKGEPRREVKR